jgi:hypothetical protein
MSNLLHPSLSRPAHPSASAKASMAAEHVRPALPRSKILAVGAFLATQVHKAGDEAEWRIDAAYGQGERRRGRGVRAWEG